MDDESRLVALAPVGHWSQERRVCLDEQAVDRYLGGDGQR